MMIMMLPADMIWGMFQGIVGLVWNHSRDPLNHVSCLNVGVYMEKYG